MSSNLPTAEREPPVDPTLSHHHPCVYRFGDIEVDFHAGELRKAGLRVHMQDQPLQVLSILVGRPGEVVSREEFRRRLWPADTFVEFDHGLNSAMKRLRDALDDDPERPRFVETIPRHGYRFIASITKSAATGTGSGGNPSRGHVPAASESSLATLATARDSQPGDTWRPRIQLWSAGKRSLVIFTICALIVGIAGVALYRALHQQTYETSRPSVVLAVLPFRDLTPVPSQSFVAEGMTQELITHLDKLDPEHVVVSARASLNSDSGEKSSSEIGSDLGVQYVLDGSTRLQGDHLRVSVQLIAVRDQRYVWAESYDETASDLLQAQATIASKVSAAIRQKLIP